MSQVATEEEIAQVCGRVDELGYHHLVVSGEVKTVIAAVGTGEVMAAIETLEGMSGVEGVVRISEPWKLASLKGKVGKSQIRINGHVIGGHSLTFIAGPCSVESESQIMDCAKAAAEAGAKVLRGGAFKPRSSPYGFQGLKEEGLRLLRQAGNAFGLSVVTEVMDTRDVESVATFADVLQIGARNMQNFPLLTEVGMTRKPVLLKRGISATLEELLLSAEYILARGNEKVILCLRGIRTYETDTRNTYDVADVPVLAGKTHLPIIVDPSHAAGRREYIAAFVRMAIASGADGVMVEIAKDPDKALTDGRQSLSFVQYAEMIRDVGPLVGLVEQERMRVMVARSPDRAES